MSYVNIMSVALELIKLVPNLINKFSTSNAESFSERIIDVAKIVTHQNNEQKAVDELKGNPQLLMEFQKIAMEIDEKMYRISYKEHKNARSRDLEIFRAGKQNVRAHIMVLIAAIGLLACPIALVMTLKNYDVNIPGEVIVIISTIAGVFGACLKDAYAFEFGSSKPSNSSKFSKMNGFGMNKNDAINAMQNNMSNSGKCGKYKSYKKKNDLNGSDPDGIFDGSHVSGDSSVESKKSLNTDSVNSCVSNRSEKCASDFYSKCYKKFAADFYSKIKKFNVKNFEDKKVKKFEKPRFKKINFKRVCKIVYKNNLRKIRKVFAHFKSKWF